MSGLAIWGNTVQPDCHVLPGRPHPAIPSTNGETLDRIGEYGRQGRRHPNPRPGKTPSAPTAGHLLGAHNPLFRPQTAKLWTESRGVGGRGAGGQNRRVWAAEVLADRIGGCGRQGRWQFASDAAMGATLSHYGRKPDDQLGACPRIAQRVYFLAYILVNNFQIGAGGYRRKVAREGETVRNGFGWARVRLGDGLQI